MDGGYLARAWQRWAALTPALSRLRERGPDRVRCDPFPRLHDTFLL